MAKVRAKLTTQERGHYSSLLNLADPIGVGKLEGKQAVEFFKKSNLSVQVLREIWELCCPNGETYLDRERFYIALKLIALAQSNLPMTIENVALGITSQLPKFESQIIQESTPSQAVQDTWLISEEQKEKYNKLFDQIAKGQKEVNGENCKQLFTQTSLPWQQLGLIWNLADSQDKGKLNREQFYVAMHIIYNVKSHQKEIPKTVPTSLLSSSGYKPDLNEVFDNLELTQAFQTMPAARGVIPGQGNVSASANFQQGFQNQQLNQQGQGINQNAFNTMAPNLQNMMPMQQFQQPGQEKVQQQEIPAMNAFNEQQLERKTNDAFSRTQKDFMNDNLLETPLYPPGPQVQIQKQPIIQQSITQIPTKAQASHYAPSQQDFEGLNKNQKNILDQSKQLEQSLSRIQAQQNEYLNILKKESQQMQNQVDKAQDKVDALLKLVNEQKKLLSTESQMSKYLMEQINIKTQEFYNQNQSQQQTANQRQDMSKQITQQTQQNASDSQQNLANNQRQYNQAGQYQNFQQAPQQQAQGSFQNQQMPESQINQQAPKQISQSSSLNQFEKQQNQQFPQSTQKTSQTNQTFNQFNQNSSTIQQSELPQIMVQQIGQQNRQFEQNIPQQQNSKVERPLPQRNELNPNEMQLNAQNQNKVFQARSTEALNIEQRNPNAQNQMKQATQNQKGNLDFFNDFSNEFGMEQVKKPQKADSQNMFDQKANESQQQQIKFPVEPQSSQSQAQKNPEQNNDPFSQNFGGFDFNSNFGQAEIKSQNMDFNFEFAQNQQTQNQDQNDPFSFNFNANFSANQEENKFQGFDFNFN